MSHDQNQRPTDNLPQPHAHELLRVLREAQRLFALYTRQSWAEAAQTVHSTEEPLNEALLQAAQEDAQRCRREIRAIEQLIAQTLGQTPVPSVPARPITLTELETVTGSIRSMQLEIQWFEDRGLDYAQGGNRTTMRYIESLEQTLATLRQTSLRSQ